MPAPGIPDELVRPVCARPANSACGTVWSHDFWRSSSLDCRFIFHCIDCALCADSASCGPNIISEGHTSGRARPAPWLLPGLPLARSQHDFVALALGGSSLPWQIRTMPRAYGP